MKCSTLILSFVLAGVSLTAQQNKMSGRVLDAATKEPIHFASVFFAGTSIGGTTHEDGTFSFEGFPNGKYDLTVTFVGFKKYRIEVDFMQVNQV
ncbi:MAG: carboxypeptidase-like regulatory domain-containing protein [Cyclobacteriaceae bacterium]